MASRSHKYSANEALAFILASDSDSNDQFGDESSLDSSNSHDSEEEPCFHGTEVDKTRYKKKTFRTYNKYRIYEMGWVTEAELLAFFGVTLAMGLTNLPEMRDYWSTSSFTSVPWFRSIFTRG